MKYRIDQKNQHFSKKGDDMLTQKKVEVKTVSANTKNVLACIAKSNEKHGKMLNKLAK